MGDSVADCSINFMRGPEFSAIEWEEEGLKLFKSAIVNDADFSLGEFAQLTVDEGCEPFLVRVIRLFIKEKEEEEGEEAQEQVGR